MSLSRISSSNKEIEDKILDELYRSIDNDESIIFSSGAGSGKTYALIESLKYILNNYEKALKEHNQNIVCITYTNVATIEVKERLGNSDLVKVSTIHERIWELIKSHQKALVEIHKERLDEEIAKLNAEIEDDSRYKIYRDLGEDQKKEFKKIMLGNNKRELFYENYSERAKDFKALFEADLSNFPSLLKNVANFKKIVSTIYKLENYSNCQTSIKSSEKGYTTVKYDSKFNSDRLHWMRISHDTLLDYGLEIIQNYDLLKQMIIDQYPYILIDEYQDTNEKVVKIVKQLSDHAVKIKHKFFVGYFGDAAQNIYNDGVGKNIENIHLYLKAINKEFNRRSTKEVIDIINNIRNDNIRQKSIYDDCEGGSVGFYLGKQEDIEPFKKRYVSEWNITTDNKLHCLVLTNKTVAEYSGFINIYDCFSKTQKYSGINYQQLNTELLSDDLTKLGDVPILLFKILNLKHQIEDSQTAVQDIIPESIYKDMNIGDLRELIKILNRIDGDSLSDYIESYANIYLETSNLNYKKIVKKLFDFENFTYEKFQNHLNEKLYPNLNDNKLDEANANIKQLLDIDLSEYESWHKYILNEQKDKVVYHTYHGTKGLEFTNVIIIMENAFGRSRNYFNSFFENYGKNKLEEKSKRQFQQVQNLLYVSCSRAIKNLRVLYLDDITKFREEIKQIFGKIHQYQI